MCVCVFVYLHGFYSVCMVTEQLTNSASRTGSTNRTDTVPPACGETNKSGERAIGARSCWMCQDSRRQRTPLNRGRGTLPGDQFHLWASVSEQPKTLCYYMYVRYIYVGTYTYLHCIIMNLLKAWRYSTHLFRNGLHVLSYCFSDSSIN